MTLLFTYKPRRVLIKPGKRQLPDPALKSILADKLPKVDWPVFVPEFLQLEPVTPKMTLMPISEELHGPVLEKPGLEISPATPDMGQLHIRSPAPPNNNNNNPSQYYQMSPQEAPSNILNALLYSPQVDQNVQFQQAGGYSTGTALSPPAQAQYIGSSPQSTSPLLRPRRSPVPPQSQYISPLLPEIIDIDIESILGGADINFGMDNITVVDGLTSNIVADGHKTEIKEKSKKQSSAKDTKQSDIVEKMSKLNM